LALTSLTKGGRLVGIVCLQTKANEFSFIREEELLYFLFLMGKYEDDDCEEL
jgi:hypothetical protein